MTKVFILSLITVLLATCNFTSGSGGGTTGTPTLPTVGKVYYISSSGNDQNEGTSPEQAWRSLSKLQTVVNSLRAGDQVLFEKGSTFRGNLVAQGVVGNEKYPIVFGTYGTGSAPIISASVELKDWQKVDKYWRASCSSCSSEMNTLTINKKAQEMGRFPNNSYLPIQKTEGHTAFYNKDLKRNPENWQGAEAVIRSKEWHIDQVRVKAHNEIKIELDGRMKYEPALDYGFFFQNHLQTLDQNGEWYYDKEAKSVYLFHPNPNSALVEGANERAAFSLKNCRYIHLNGIVFEQGNKITLELDKSPYIQVKSCEIRASGGQSVSINSSPNFLVQDCKLQEANTNGFFIQFSPKGTVENCEIKSVGMHAGMGDDLTAIRLRTNDVSIKGCDIQEVGYCGIAFRGSGINIQENHVREACLILNDGGGIYTWNSPEDNFSGCKIERNIVYGVFGNPAKVSYAGQAGAGHGIYIDDRVGNISVTNNHIHECQTGIYVHNAHDVRVLNNSAFNNRETQLLMRNDEKTVAPHKIRNSQVHDNIFFAQKPEQRCMVLRSNQNDLEEYGTFRGNALCSPIEVVRPHNPLLVNRRYVAKGGEQYEELGFKAWVGTGQTLNPTTLSVSIPVKNVGSTSGSNLLPADDPKAQDGGWKIWSSEGNGLLSREFDGEAGMYIYKLSFKRYLASENLQIFRDGIPFNQNKSYRISFEAKGSKAAQLLLTPRLNKKPYTKLFETQTFRIRTQYEEHSFVFKPKQTYGQSRLSIRLNGRDKAEVFMKNIQIKEVQSQQSNPADFIQFHINPSNEPKVISLTGSHRDGKNQLHTGQYELPAWSSVVLVKE